MAHLDEKSAYMEVALENGKEDAYVYDNGAVAGESFTVGDSYYARAQRFAGKFKIEQRGIERVPENERHDTSLLNVGTMWFSANMVVSSFAIGCLGYQIFFLGLLETLLVILFFNLLGITTVCYFSAFGPPFGLRQMVLSRFWFGWWGVKLIAVFNCLACLGWSAVNAIVGAQLIHAVNNNVPGWAAILIIAFCTLLVTMFGYKVVHSYEFWSWIPTTIVFFIVLGEFASQGLTVHTPSLTGPSNVAGCLSFGSIVFGFATGWTPYAADYTVYHPSTQSKKKVFLWTWLGLIIPLLFTEMLGAWLVTATAMNDGNNVYQAAYTESGSGGLIGAIIFPKLGNFGKFCVVVLALSIIANNCPNIYSVSLTVQVFGRWTQAIPRFIWTLVGTGVYIAVAIPGYLHFQVALSNFMDFIGYWLAAYEGVALCDHFFFKKGLKGYHPEDYDKPEKLPPGIAAIGAFILGVVGFVLGMAQVWYVSVLAAQIEPKYGGDIGFELAFGFAFVSYYPFRLLELKYFGR